VFVVDVGEDNLVSARHFTDYLHRPFQRLTFDVEGYSQPAELLKAAIEYVNENARIAEPGVPSPIIEITLCGRLGFPNSALDLRKLRDDTQKRCAAFHVRVRNMTVPVELDLETNGRNDLSRELVERRVVEGLIGRDKRYARSAPAMTEAVIYAKEQALLGEEPEKIAESIAAKTLPGNSPREHSSATQ
jgi:hypothetical protein